MPCIMQESKIRWCQNTQQSEDKRIYILKSEKPAKAVVKLGVPLIAGMFIMVLYNLVDTYFIGLMHDDYQLAAVNLAYPIMMISIAISNMIGTGASSLIARSLGAGDNEKANHTLTVGFVLTVINSVIVAGIGLILLDAIVKGLGAQANTFEYTRRYVQVILAGSLLTMGNYTFGQLLRSEGSVKQSVAGMIVGTVVNIILDPIFIFALGMEIRGAAIATILGNGAGMCVSLWFYLRGKTLLRPSGRYIRPTAEILREIFWVGVPATMETLLTSAAYIVNNNLAVQYGELTVAAMGIAQKILSLGNYIYQGFAAGTQPIMGYNYGAKNYRRMLDVLKAAGGHRDGKQGAAQHHVHSAVCRSGLHEQNVLPGHGQTAVRVWDHPCQAARPVCTASFDPEQTVRIQRYDQGAARHGADHDDRFNKSPARRDPAAAGGKGSGSTGTITHI